MMREFEQSEARENTLLMQAAAAALEEALTAKPEEMDTEGIDTLLDFLEQSEDIAMPDDVFLEEKKRQTKQAMARKRRFAPKRLLAAAAVFAVLLLAGAAVLLIQNGVFRQGPARENTAALEPGQTTVDGLMESLQAHAFPEITLSQVFLEDGWTVTEPLYYSETDKLCVDFQLYNADVRYCFNLKYTEEAPEDYAALGAEKVKTIEKEVIIYVFNNGADGVSEMRYRVDNLNYNITANVPSQTMIQTANQIQMR